MDRTHLLRNALGYCLAALCYALASPSVAATNNLEINTRSGTSFAAPRDWRPDFTSSATVLSAPEADTHIAIVEVAQAVDSKTAAAMAWHAYRPDKIYPATLPKPLSAHGGWDEKDVIGYDIVPGAGLNVWSMALRKGSSWTVFIMDGTSATSEKHGAAIDLILQSLHPTGYVRESFAGRTAHSLDPARIAQILSFVRNSAAELDVPGVGLALIDHGKIVYEGGIGVRRAAAPDLIDAHTRFLVASNTKSMTTLLLAEMVDRGELRWDEPVVEAYPQFRLGDSATTNKVLIRHLVCACTGLPREDYPYLFTTTENTPPSVTFAMLATTKPTTGFGETFQYSNLIVAAAGYVAGHVAYPNMEFGAAYDKAMQKSVFDPLDMHDTTLSMRKALATNHASPHAEELDGTLRIVSQDINFTFTPFRPDGGAWSSAHDMALFVQNELSEGVLPDGRRLVSASNLLARRARGVPMGDDRWYGMGLMEDATSGVSVFHHGGDTAGYHSDMFFIPSAGVGAVILTNAENGAMMREPFLRRLMEVLYDGNPEAAADISAQRAGQRIDRAEWQRLLTVPASPADTAQLANRYVSPDLGVLIVERQNGRTRFRVASWSSEVATRHGQDGSVLFTTIDPTLDGVGFIVGSAGGKRTLTTRDGQHTYVFTEQQSSFHQTRKRASGLR